METLILLTIIVVTILLGRYAIEEGQRQERHKKFMKDMENFDNNKKRKIK